MVTRRTPVQTCVTRRVLLFYSLLSVVLLFGLNTAALASELTIYSGRKESAIKPVVELFERQTGIKVALKVGKTSGLANAILRERVRPRADIFIATEAGVCEILARKGLLEPYASAAALAIPSGYKSARGLWAGISGRARVIIYNTNLVRDGDTPDSILDLTEVKWRGKIAIAGTRERTTLAWLSALVESMGEAKAKTYINKLLNNGLTVLPDNSNVWRGVGSGEFAVGLTNSPNYYLARQAGLPVGVVYPDQGQGDMGALVNPNAVTIVKGAKNLDQARRFVDFLFSKPAQELLVHHAFEIPLLPGIDPGQVLPLSGFKSLQISRTRLADLEEKTITLFPDL